MPISRQGRRGSIVAQALVLALSGPARGQEAQPPGAIVVDPDATRPIRVGGRLSDTASIALSSFCPGLSGRVADAAGHQIQIVAEPIGLRLSLASAMNAVIVVETEPSTWLCAAPTADTEASAVVLLDPGQHGIWIGALDGPPLGEYVLRVERADGGGSSLASPTSGDRIVQADDPGGAAADLRGLEQLPPPTPMPPSFSGEDLSQQRYEDLDGRAPRSLDADALGRPITRDFQLFLGQAARPLFDVSGGHVKRIPRSEFRHEVLLMRSASELKANASGWGGAVSAEVSRGKVASLLVYRAYQVTEVVTLIDDQMIAPVPEGGLGYVEEIVMGRIYEVVFRNEEGSISGELRANLLTAQGSIGGWAAEQKLEMSVTGIGLDPRGDAALFAHDPASIEQNYRQTAGVFPIFVKYRTFPDRGRELATRINAEFPLIFVYRDGSMGTSTWRLRVACRIRESVVFDDLVFAHDDVDEIGQSGYEGPSRVSSYAAYALGAHFSATLRPDEQLDCVASGREVESGTSLPGATFLIGPRDPPSSEPFHVGGGNGKTEYWLWVRLSRPDLDPPTESSE